MPVACSENVLSYVRMRRIFSAAAATIHKSLSCRCKNIRRFMWTVTINSDDSFRYADLRFLSKSSVGHNIHEKSANNSNPVCEFNA